MIKTIIKKFRLSLCPVTFAKKETISELIKLLLFKILVVAFKNLSDKVNKYPIKNTR